jgi:DNA-directed RNA polymerase subunit RPC12/RpoP
VLLLLLDEQTRQISIEIQDRQKQLEAIRVVRDDIRSTGQIPGNSIRNIEQMMNRNKTLKRTHVTMLAVGLLMDVVLIATVMKGLWIPFAVGVPVIILVGIFLTRMYYKNTEYICAECNTKFRPSVSQFIFSRHTPKTRKLTCPHCRHTGYCVEIGTERKS